MGVGFASDLVICTALGIDMFDCVFPTRTAVIIQNHMFEKVAHLCKIFYAVFSFSRDLAVP